MSSVKSLGEVSFDILFGAFNEAFVDYEIQLEKEEFRKMLMRRGFIPSLSFGIFDAGKLISFTLNGIGSFNGEKTAYDTGTGTIAAYRGRGLASKIFMDSLPILKEAGVTQYLLEVLQHNTNAVSVYKKLGFAVSREFNYYSQPVSLVHIPSKELSPPFYIAEMVDKEGACNIFSKLSSFLDFSPSWQNSFESIHRRVEDFKFYGAFNVQEIVGYCIFEPNTGDISQIAVDKSHRRLGIASALLSEALKENNHDRVKLINTEISCENIASFMHTCGIPLKGKQFEMIRKI